MKVILNNDLRIQTDTVITRISRLLANIPDLEAHVFQEQTALELMLGTETMPVIIEIQGEDLDRIQELTEQIKGYALASDELFNVETKL